MSAEVLETTVVPASELDRSAVARVQEAINSLELPEGAQFTADEFVNFADKDRPLVSAVLSALKEKPLIAGWEVRLDVEWIRQVIGVTDVDDLPVELVVVNLPSVTRVDRKRRPDVSGA